MSTTPLRIVLETLIGANPYHPEANYPRELLVTFVKSPNGKVRRILFDLYGKRSYFRAEARHLPGKWPGDTDLLEEKRVMITVERGYYLRVDRWTIDSERICGAFLKVALERSRQEIN